MSRLKQFVEKQKKLSRFQILKSIFTSFAMTVTIVVVAVIVIPASPEGEILDIDRFTNSIVYSVHVTDPDSAIIDDTLKIQLVNQSETYEQLISVGDSTGVFDNLNAETQYTIKILADKGFGLEVLDSEKFYTEENTGGAITQVSLQEPYDYLLNYNISYFISDPFNEYTEIQLRYGYKYDYEEEITNFTTVTLSTTESSINIGNIYNSNLDVFLYLEAFNSLGEVIELDMLVVRTPYQIYGSFSIDRVDSNQIIVSMYPDMMEGLDIEYEIVLKRNYQTIDRQTVDFEHSDSGFHHDGASIVFDKLKSNVEYTIELYATYIHPYTLVETEELLYTEYVTTLGQYTSTFELEEFDEYYEVSITLNDPEDIFNIAYFNVFEMTEYGNLYYRGQTVGFQVMDDEKYVIILIDKPLLDDYIIEIGIGNSMIYYNYSVLKEIEINGGNE